MDENSPLYTEIELISSSLLPSEEISTTTEGTDVIIKVISSDSSLSLLITLGSAYPARDSVKVEMKGDFGRDEAEGWQVWIDERMEGWDDTDEYPLYQLITTHFLPLLSSPVPASSVSSKPTPTPPAKVDQGTYHTLLLSHHLIAPSKRRDLLHLSKSLNLIGFCKTGYPGVMYVVGDHEAVEEWLKEVKSWQWLALKTGISVEGCRGLLNTGGNGSGASEDVIIGDGKKERGEWSEVEKIGEALEWLRGYGRERMLLDLGIGGGSER